jgi:hypothetical protein
MVANSTNGLPFFFFPPRFTTIVPDAEGYSVNEKRMNQSECRRYTLPVTLITLLSLVIYYGSCNPPFRRSQDMIVHIFDSFLFTFLVALVFLREGFIRLDSDMAVFALPLVFPVGS